MRAGMVGRALLGVLMVATISGIAAPALAQPQPPPVPVPPAVRPGANTPLILVLDSSGSMRADDGTGRPKIEAAKEALLRLVDELPEGTPVGLRVYGHRFDNSDRARGCTDTELLQPVVPLDRERLRQAIGSFQPNGFTPIGTSLEAALGDLPDGQAGTVVLVSDGIDTCAPPDPCAVAQRLAADNVELRVETVGFQVDAAAAGQLSCIADAMGGQFRGVGDSEGLLRALREYRVAGSPITGGASAAEAPLVQTGQFLDKITPGQQRWYAVELEEGEALRTITTVVGERGGPVAADAVVNAELFTDDVLGVISCGRDEEFRLGQEARQVGVDGLINREGVCSEPGRYALRVEVADPSGALAGQEFDVELLVSQVRDSSQPPPAAEPAANVRRAEDDFTGTPAGPSSGSYLTAGIIAALIGLLLGALVARRQAR